VKSNNTVAKGWRFVAALTFSFLCGVAGLVWYVFDLQSRLITTGALESAEFYTTVMKEFRSLYSSEVVSRVRGVAQVQVTHDYLDHERAIPLPATLGMKLGERIGMELSGAKTALYSAYPFPWRQAQGGLNDEFRRQAWEALTLDSEKPYFEFTTQEGIPVLRYASADIMRESCVDCHNSHPDTPKSDWNVGDVRGVLEIIYPMTNVIDQNEVGKRGAFIWTSFVVVFGVVCLGSMIFKFKVSTKELERRVKERTAEVEKTERSLRQSMEFNNRLLETVRTIIIGVDTKDSINYWNSLAEEYFGKRREDVMGRQILDVGLKWDWQKVCTKILDSMASESYSNRFEIDYEREYGGRSILSISIAPILGALDKHKGYLIIADDITEQKNQQSEKAQKDKLQSIGQLAAGIAHEINTPIQYLGDNTRFLQEIFGELNEVVVKGKALVNKLVSGDDIGALQTQFGDLWEEYDIDYIVDDVPRAIEQSLEGVERVSTIVKAMKEFSHPGFKEKDKTDINRAIENTITISRGVWKYVAEMETDFDPKMGEISCFVGPLNDVVLNMIVNSAQAIDSLGENGPSLQGLIRITTKRHVDFGEIRIKDTGPGIALNIQKRVFDPFFTTKEVGKGTGQGLSLSRNIIVEQHGGELFFETEAGKGTTFVIRLPIEGHDSERRP
jgi:PAS domain S-box-containing protein